MSEQRDRETDYVEANSASSVSPREEDSGSQDGGSSGRRTPQQQTEARFEQERTSRVGSLIMQAANQARVEEQAQATARTAAQIAAQKRKMRGRAKRIMHAEDVPEAEPYYDMENAMRSSEMGQKDMTDSRNHDSYTQEGKPYNLPLPPAFALLDIGKPGKKTSQGWVRGALWYRILMWTLLSLLAITAAAGAVVLMLYLTLNPKQPEYSLEEIRVQSWRTYKDELGEMPYSKVNGVPVSTVYLYSTSDFIILARNKNKKISVVYPNTTFEIFYHRISLGKAQAPSLVLDPSTATHIVATWTCDACPLPEIGEYLLKDGQSGSVPLKIVMTVDVGASVDGVVTPKYEYVVDYDVRVRPPGT